MFKLDGKVSLITGAGSGIGQAIALLFAKQGARVWAIDRDEAGGRATVAKIRAAGGIAEFETFDVASEADALKLATRLPTLDILANVAGIGHVGALPQTAAADLDRLYAVNVRGIFNLCKAFVPTLLERRSGSVINMASVGGIIAVRPCIKIESYYVYGQHNILLYDGFFHRLIETTIDSADTQFAAELRPLIDLAARSAA